MTDDDLMQRICSIVRNDHPIPTLFDNGARNAAFFCVGALGTDPYRDTQPGQPYPWKAIFQAGQIAGLFNPAPGMIATIMLLYLNTVKTFTHHESTNFINAVEVITSPHTFKTFAACLVHETPTSRQFECITNLMVLAHIHNALYGSNQSMDLEYVTRSVTRISNYINLPLCNADVDAHPVAKNLIRSFLEAIAIKLEN